MDLDEAEDAELPEEYLVSLLCSETEWEMTCTSSLMRRLRGQNKYG